MCTYYLAIDIGASSGRHILASVVNGKIILEEIYRFPNQLEEIDGSLCWNVKKIFQEILNGLKKCKEIGKIPSYMGIDTWAIDYVLLDKENNILGKTYGYRDHRTMGMDEKVSCIISSTDLYTRTGIQKQLFNTIYQLMSTKELEPELMKIASHMLMIPDYFNYLLTGQKKTEYTNATTTQLVNPNTKNWDYELITMLGFNPELFCPICVPGTLIGSFTENIENELGFNCQVILPATHDTGSAVLAIPTNNTEGIYISSGTWSLMGIESNYANCSLDSMKLNFTNEGGYQYRFRYLKNIMGLWMIQSVKKEFSESLSFDEICYRATKETISSTVDCNAPRFLSPENMILEIQNYCKETNQQIPRTIGEIASVIYNSLSICYEKTVQELEPITHKKYNCIHIVGGGSNAKYLNQLTANRTNKIVYAGPTEATALGNLIVQMIYSGQFQNLSEARQCIKNSFNISKFFPYKEEKL